MLSPRWTGPFKVLARTVPNTRRPDRLGGKAAPPPPLIGADGRPEHEVQELLKFKVRWGRLYVLST